MRKIAIIIMRMAINMRKITNMMMRRAKNNVFYYDGEDSNTAVEKPDLTRSGCRSADVRRETDLWRKA